MAEEKSITVDEAGEIAMFAKDARKVARIGFFTLSPVKVAEAVDSYVAKTQQELIAGARMLGEEEATFLALQLGCLYGQQAVKEFGWSWTCLVNGENENYAVVNSDRSLALLPTYFIRECFEQPGMDCTLLLAFNMVSAKRFSDVAARGYHDVLGHVVRIVPRH